MIRTFKWFPLAALLSFIAPLFATELKPDVVLKLERALQDLQGQVKPEKAHKVLAYTRAIVFVNGSIPVRAKCFELMDKKPGAFEVTKIAEDPAIFDSDLNEYDAIVLMSCTGDFLK